MTNEPYREGVQACDRQFQSGEAIANPYAQGTVEHTEFARGYWEAYEAYQEKQREWGHF